MNFINTELVPFVYYQFFELLEYNLQIGGVPSEESRQYAMIAIRCAGVLGAAIPMSSDHPFPLAAVFLIGTLMSAKSFSMWSHFEKWEKSNVNWTAMIATFKPARVFA